MRSAAARLDCELMEPDSADDAELLRAHSAGDPHAFARLYDRYDRPCFQFIRRMLGAAHADAAEDLHQEAWMAVSRSAGAFDPGQGRFPRLAVHHRPPQGLGPLPPAEGGRAGVGRGGCGDDGPGPGPDAAASRCSRASWRERLVAAVEALPLEQRGAFVMFAHAGLSLEEIAQATGVGVETAKSRLRYARATLRQTLAGERSAHV